MTYTEPFPLLVGEIFVDYTLTARGEDSKLRLGGIVHAARRFWALNAPFSVAAVLPSYLEDLARQYLLSLGCVDFHVLGEVGGGPNLTVIHDAPEVAAQEYDTLLRDEKSVKLSKIDLANEIYRDILIFPGSYDLLDACKALCAASPGKPVRSLRKLRITRLRSLFTSSITTSTDLQNPWYQPGDGSHCHQKFLMTMKDGVDLMCATGAEVDLLDSGCCDMAGPFSFEAEHYDVSQALAERVFLPVVQSAKRGLTRSTGMLPGLDTPEQYPQNT
jgi:hypothetical protein